MKHLALLRGINVGGHNKINMKELKQTFENAGMSNVITYINTGNIIFDTTENNKEKLSKLLNQAIQKDFNLDIKVLIRDHTQIKNLLKQIPSHWTNDQEMKSDIMFLWESINTPEILNQITTTKFDTVQYLPNTLIWSIQRKNQTKSGMIKLIGTKIYKQMTIRNINTTRKIATLMSQ